MKIKTKRDALLTCFDLWIWIAATGSTMKSDWPEWAFNGGEIETCLHSCPCCEFARKVQKRECDHNDPPVCPVTWANIYCEFGGSEFGSWYRARSEEEREKCALAIAVLALEALTE